MTVSADLRTIYEQQTRVLRRHPTLGRVSAQANVRLVAELACEARRANRVTRVDLPADEGGRDSAPTPGDLIRAGLGACLAMGYRIWAARLDVDLQAAEVNVTCELDVRGQLGIADDVPIGWQRLLFDARVTSNAAATDVRNVVECANRLSPMLANLSPAIERVHTLTILRPEPTLSTLDKETP